MSLSPVAGDGSPILTKDERRYWARTGVAYTPELGQAICAAYSRIPKSLETICATHEGFPGPDAVWNWRRQFPEFRQMWEEARELRADTLFDQIIEIADDSSEDELVVTRNDGKQVVTMNREFVQRSQLRCDARFKKIKYLNPNKYGDKLDINATHGFVRHEDALDQLR